jgi:rRNA maturation protein Nop10
MAKEEQKTFKFVCPHCGQPSTVRYSLAQPGSPKTADVVINCQYCGEDFMVTVPEKYVPEDHLVRGLKGVSKKD